MPEPADPVAVKDAVREVWQDVLATIIDDDSDFFGLGGDSHAAVAICARLGDRYSVRPRIRVLFDQPRFADYATSYECLLQEVSRCSTPT